MGRILWYRIVGILLAVAVITAFVLFIRWANNDKIDFNGDVHLSPTDLVADAAGYSGRTTYVDGQVTIIPDEIISLTFRVYGGGTSTYHDHTDISLSTIQTFKIVVGNQSVIVIAGNSLVEHALSHGVRGDFDLLGQLLEVVTIVHGNGVVQDYSNDANKPVVYRVDTITHHH